MRLEDGPVPFVARLVKLKVAENESIELLETVEVTTADIVRVAVAENDSELLPLMLDETEGSGRLRVALPDALEMLLEIAE